MLNGDAGLPYRSSSPLKRRASSMNPDGDAARNGDVDMTLSHHGELEEDAPGSGTRAMSLDPPENGDSTTHASSKPKPPLMEQVKVIETFLKAFSETPVKEGDMAYLVSRSWVNKALDLRSNPKRVDNDVAADALGPIDNSDIVEEVIQTADNCTFTRLKPGADLEDFELFPEEAWNLVMSWYGLRDGQGPVTRIAVNSSPDAQTEPNIMYELHPPVFHVYRLWSELSPLPIEQALKASNPVPYVVVRSQKHHLQTFFKELKNITGIPIERKFRVWILPQELPTGAEPQLRSALTTPPDSPGRTGTPADASDPWSHFLIDVVAFSQIRNDRREVQAKDQTANENYNGKLTLQLSELGTDRNIALDEAIDDSWVSTYNGRSRPSANSHANRSNMTAKSLDGRSSPSPHGPMTRGRAQQKRRGRNLGAVGLQNLGNTCYMNSALQCVRSVEELSKYFLTGTYEAEINKTNPLGYYGKVAMAYATLLNEIFDEGRGSISPRDFKATVGKCRSTFSGFGQQDSQEFLGFLLDALQEDLSRIKKKPYIEKPDSTDEMINDPEAIREMANKVWDITRKRDDSIVADLFTGMYKSTLKCPECGKVSITFDPFNNLTLPLPVENVDCRTVKFYPLNDVPVKFEVELKKHSAIEAVKQFISERTGVPMSRLMGAEEFKGTFFKIYDNNQDASEEIGSGDVATIHEIEAAPTNWPGKARRKYPSMLDVESPPQLEWDDSKYERMVIPVFHRRPEASVRVPDALCPPHFIILNKDEALDIDKIRRKVLAKVATFSTWAKLAETTDSASTDTPDTDMVFTMVSDGDSSGDSKIAAHSVEGEEDMVDVTMKDASDLSGMKSGSQSKILRRFDTRRPAFLDSEELLDPELQNLFELGYFPGGGELVPTGWQSVDNNKALPRLSDRIPEAHTVEEEQEEEEGADRASPESWNSTTTDNDASSNEDDNASRPDAGQTRMVDESSEEDASPTVPFNTRSGGPGGRKKFKGHKTYGKKGNKRRDKQMRANKHQHQRMPAVKPQPMPPAVPDGGPLIRLGEGLVVDWTEDAWETAFGGAVGDSQPFQQGAKTFTDLEIVHDPGLKFNQKRRATRRSRGITLEECLDEFERAEILSEQDMWYCPRCKEHRRASKKFDLWKTPDILVAHLKRFSSSGWRRDKLDFLVDFPTEGLDLTSRVIQKEKGKDEIYDLIAVDDHYGGLGGGHYTAYAKNFVDGQWYNYNDSSVSEVSDPSQVVTNAAYLLFYRRRSSVPLGGPRFVQIFEKYDNPDEDDHDESEAGKPLQINTVLGGKGSDSEGALTGRPTLDRRGTRTTVTPIAGPDDDDDGLPSYDNLEQGDALHNSIEDEAIELPDGYDTLRPDSLDMTQGWNFNGLDPNAADRSKAGEDGGSDDVQLGSSSSEPGDSQDVYDHDTDMLSTGGGNEHQLNDAAPGANAKGQKALSGVKDAAWDRTGVISVPSAADDDGNSDDVAEIHLDGDKGSKSG